MIADTQATDTNDPMCETANETIDPLPPHYNLQPARDCLYNHRLALHMNASAGTKSYDPHVQLFQFASNNMETCPGDMFSYIFGFMMTQMMASQGIKNMARKPLMHSLASSVNWMTRWYLSQWMLQS